MPNAKAIVDALATNQGQAGEVYARNQTPRQRALEMLERFVKGTQYEGRPSWWDDSTPLWERAPCIVYPMAKIAIRSNTDLVLGESRFPLTTSNPGEDDAQADGLNENDSELVDRAIIEVCNRVRFRAVSRQALDHAQGAKSVAGIIGARKGRLFVELVRSRWCEPQRDEHGDTIGLEIRYPYEQTKKSPDGTYELVTMLFRRTIDAKRDTTYLPILAPTDGSEPKPELWQVDPKKDIEHKLGFCPVVWYPFCREISTVDDFDGVAVHEEVTDEIQGLDFAISQKHRAALFLGDPQIIETGVEEGDGPGAGGRSAVVPSTANGGRPSSDNPITGSYGAQDAPKRVKSPGSVWTYESSDAKVSYLFLPDGALEVLDSHAADLRNKIAESLATVILDPQNLKLAATISGKAIEQLRARQFDRCDQIRDDVADGWVLPCVKMLLRVALTLRLAIKAVRNATKALAPFLDDTANAPLLFVRWPVPYVRPDAEEEANIVNATILAYQAKVITRAIAIQQIAAIFNISSVKQAEEALDKEAAKSDAKAAESHARELELAHVTMGALNGADPDDRKPNPADEG